MKVQTHYAEGVLFASFANPCNRGLELVVYACLKDIEPLANIEYHEVPGGVGCRDVPRPKVDVIEFDLSRYILPESIFGAHADQPTARQARCRQRIHSVVFCRCELSRSICEQVWDESGCGMAGRQLRPHGGLGRKGELLHQYFAVTGAGAPK